MNHKQLTHDLFKKHFPEWLDERHVETVMKRTLEAFEVRGVGSFYNSLAPEAKRERYERREAKIVERKNKINPRTIEKQLKVMTRGNRRFLIYKSKFFAPNELLYKQIRRAKNSILFGENPASRGYINLKCFKSNDN